MDVILPSHSLRTFAAAVTCLTKIGKEAYLDFDPLDGLILRTLNDAKSAYAQHRFAPEFFERCSAPPTAVSGLGGGGKKRKVAGGSGGRQQRSRKVGRGGAGGGNSSGRSRSRSRGGSGDDGTEDDDDDDFAAAGGHAGGTTATTTQESDDDDRFLCRVNLRTLHAALRSRRGVHTLRIRSLGVGADLPPTPTPTQDNGGGNNNTTSSGNHADDGDNDQAASSSSGTRLQLSLEFLVESPKTGGTLRIVHRLAVSDAEGVTAVASRAASSEIVTSPNVFLRLLDPLKRTNEVALTVDDVGQTVTATSFHHGDAVTGGNGGGGGGIENNAVLRNAAASAGVLKTEASIGVEEFVEYHWRDDRKEDELGGGDDDDEETGGGGGNSRRNDSQDDDDAIPPGNPPPPKVNEEVTLVFGIKEARAMLQFCAAASTDVEMDAVLCFHWGGRPVVVEAEEEEGRFSAELILATLDHQLVGRGVRRQVGGAGGRSGT